MSPNAAEPSLLRFGVFQLNLESGELYKNGTLIRLPPQPSKVLALLASRAGHVVSREEIQKQIWSGDTFVDFDKGLNFCIQQIRGALGDDAEKPRYIETLPRRGYRFLAPVMVKGLERAATADAVVVPAPRAEARRWRLWLAMALVAAMAVAAGLGLFHARSPHLAFQERDWVLISSFENRTGESVFDGTLEYALERELSNSRFVNVVPRERISDTLQLMKKPLDTRVDAALGREICLRDGGIRVLLTGRVEKLDTTYVLSASLTNPVNGVTVASLSEEASGQKEVVPAVRRLTGRLRRTLGEELSAIQLSEQKLEKVTTPSLRALQLYSQGMALVNQDQYVTAAELLERALAEDPDFASAHILLAHCYNPMNEAFERADPEPHFQRAFQLAETTSDRERYFILGSYYELRSYYYRFLPNQAKALAAYEILIRLYPDHYWGVNNLAGPYDELGRHEEAAKLFVRRAELRPNDFATNALAARALTGPKQTQAQARLYVERARALAASGVKAPYPTTLAWVELFPAYEFWMQNDVAQANRVLDNFYERIKAGGTGGPWEEGLLFSVASFYLSLGKLHAAEELYQRMTEIGFAPAGFLAQAAYTRGDMVAVREHLARVKQVAPRWASVWTCPTIAVLKIRAGFPLKAKERACDFERDIRPVASNLIWGELALAHGETRKAVTFLQEAQRLTKGWGVETDTFFLASDSLAAAYERQGDVQRAIGVLEEASLERTKVYAFYGMMGHYWLTIRNRLAQLYRKTGRLQDAQKIEAELLRLLALADPDHPMLRELKHTEQEALKQTRQ